MVLFYLVAYMFGNMGAFFVVQAVAASEGSDDIEKYQGLARRSPVLALSLLLFLLSLGGIPFMAGFWAKLFVFWAVVEQGMYVLAFLGAVMTVVALYYYLVVARRMYIEEPASSGADSRARSADDCDRRLRRRNHRDGRLSRAMGARVHARGDDAVRQLVTTERACP